MTRATRYAGLQGVLDIGETEPLSEDEQRVLRDNIETVLLDADDPDAFLAEIVHIVHRLRDLQKLDRERITIARRDEVDAALKAIKRGDRMPRLTQICRRDLTWLRARMPDASEHDLLAELRVRLPKPGKGRAPDDALVLAAAMLADKYRAHMPRPPRTTKEGHFVILLQAVASAADGKARESLHHVAEEALKIPRQTYSEGVTFYDRQPD